MALAVGFEARARSRGYSAPAGVDEAGRGPLAGPVVAAAVIFPPGYSHPGIRDSKKLSPRQRERLFTVITADAVAFGIAHATHEEIDSLNILRASLLAMRRAVDALALPPDFLFIDGNRPIPSDVPQETLVGGDDRCLSVAAASILAKVARDRMMVEYDLLYPGYGLSAHKGYPTREHLEAIRRLGPSPIHRRTFRGVLA
ncbi:MAG TPA: ribonuclease HII [Deltaproteobacteria bacterium]|nr:MAG: ribonuclease HII [Deltaproteobacteria bacterium GWA2_65_63]OGP27436.1 MAG: ribonuclease HII [Deltaproteobacteria bacterium GWB2_65_81]OGP37446.1 MAG: ribonuclease HII [Deltaproteobacteria bacterium GWC2_66_88]HAM34046.1 ribonuclease HII [Deltaproteobacteria bacterium]HBG73352.1 ribonuclease HII [Deltaproteobacteria bacterium]